MPCGTTQDGQVMVERSDRMWSTGEGNGKPLQFSCLENPMNSMKRQNDRILKEEHPRSVGAQNASGEEAPERMKRWSQSKNNTQLWMWLVMEVKSNAVEQYCIGTWNVRSMNHSKLEVVKREMVRVNTNILGISELKRTGMGEFNSDDHCIYYYGKEFLWRNGVPLIVNKRVQNAVFGCSLKNDRMTSVHFQQTI